MKLEYILLILISAFFHSFYNFLMKKNKGSQFFLLCIYMVASIVSIMPSLITGEYIQIEWKSVPYVYAASFFYIVYHVFASKAYQRGNISTTYPLTLLSPIFIPIWAFTLLNEKVTPIAWLGIVITLIGAMSIKVNIFSIGNFSGGIQKLSKYKGSGFALFAAFAYSFGAVFDKIKIDRFTTINYMGLLIPFMCINLLIYNLIFEKEAMKLRTGFSKKLLVSGGISLALSFLFFRFALKEVPVSIAVPMRLISIIFAIVLGVTLLKEKITKRELLSALIIIAGITIINLGHH